MPKKGTKYLTSLPARGLKTGRAYAGVVSIIRAEQGLLTDESFLPEISQRQARNGLTWLYRRGEIQRIRKGVPGIRPQAAIYWRAA